MPTTLRHLAMLRRIPRAPAFITTPDLRSALESLDYTVDIRTVQRDLEALSSVFPLYCDTSSKPFRWQWLAGGEVFDIPGIDAHSALVFKLAGMFLEPLLPVSAMETLMPYFRCADRVLGESGARCGSWSDKVRVLPRGQRLLMPDVSRTVLDGIHQGLFFGRMVKILYKSRGKQDFKEYLINPLGLVLRNGLIYLVCTFSGYEDIRQLLLHRMRQAEVVNEPCAVPDGFDLDGYIQDQEFDLARGRPDIPLRFRFRAVPASALYETPLSADQVITPLADRQWVEVSATVADTDQLRWWLLGFGNQVEVLEPVALREEFCAIAQDMGRLYAASDSV